MTAPTLSQKLVMNRGDETTAQLHEPPGGLEEVVNVLLQQQSTLQGIVQMQAELRSLTINQHEVLERKLHEFTSKAKIWDLEHEHQPLRFSEHTVAESPEGHASEEQRTSEQPAYTANRITQSDILNKVKKNSNRQSKEEGPKDCRSRVKKFVTNPYFDLTMGVMIILNFVFILAELEWKSKDLAFQLEIKPDNSGWYDAEPVFKAIEKCFNAIFLIELLVMAFAFKCRCIKGVVPGIDALVVIMSAVDSFIIDPIVVGDGKNVRSFLRLLRVLRTVRVLRFLRVLKIPMKVFSSLRVLVQTIQMSLGSLVFSMTIIFFVVTAAALFMSTVTQDIMENPELSKELRLWTYHYYGGVMRSGYSMFEATFSAKWATHLSSDLIHEVSPLYSVWWIFYTIVVNFAIMRVIAALFLKQTLDMAAKDAERVQAQKFQELQRTVQILREIFEEADQAGDGVLHRWEFEDMLVNEDIQAKFEKLELESHELRTLYDILAEDDGVADQEEFLNGAMKLKTTVRSVDIIHIMHETASVKRQLASIAEGVSQVDRALHPKAPWKPKVCEMNRGTTRPPSPLTDAAGKPGADAAAK